jgi:hypothetical protein
MVAKRSCVAASRLFCCSASIVFLAVLLASRDLPAQQKKGGPAKGKQPQSAAAKNFPDVKTPEDKLRVLEMVRQSFTASRGVTRTTSLAQDLDAALERELAKSGSTALAPVVDDETFLRRVSLDLTGVVPTADRIKSFVADVNPNKRARVIDELLETDGYARKWARYWRSVVFHDSDANRNTINPQAFEDWLFTEFKQGTGWDRIVAEMISASPKRNPKVRPQENGWQQDHGPNNFILACERKPEVIAKEVSRLFMGTSVGCAECHDHPFDKWKREQFHEMAAFFAPGKYTMPDQNDPTQKTEMQAKFLLGEEPPPGMKPDQLRVIVAGYLIYNPDNYWFARAFVNRIWNELLGDGFYAVDSLGPDKEVVHQLIANRVAAQFRNLGFDIKWLFRTITNTRAYQREIRTLDEASELFTAVRPARLRPYEVADNLEQLLGEHTAGPQRTLARAVRQTFDQDPSVPQRDLEGSIQQALLMMNDQRLHDRLARSALKQDLMKLKPEKDVVREAFLGTLARSPTAAETDRFVKHLRQVKDRNEAVDDLLWVLVNSAEFVTKR